MDLWSSSIGANPVTGGMGHGTRYPVTLLRTQVFYRNATLREHGFWVGTSGIHCTDKHYTFEPSMPHQAHIYDCRQSLDLHAGLAVTSGCIVLGSPAAEDEARCMAFTTCVALLKDSKLLGMEIIAEDDETEILFAPELVLRDRLRLGSEALGIAHLGNQIDCDLEMRQTLLGTESKGLSITYRVQLDGSAPYLVTLTAAQESVVELIDFHGRPAFKARGRGFFNVEIDADAEVPPADLAGLASAEAFFH